MTDEIHRRLRFRLFWFRSSRERKPRSLGRIFQIETLQAERLAVNMASLSRLRCALLESIFRFLSFFLNFDSGCPVELPADEETHPFGKDRCQHGEHSNSPIALISVSLLRTERFLN